MRCVELELEDLGKRLDDLLAEPELLCGAAEEDLRCARACVAEALKALSLPDELRPTIQELRQDYWTDELWDRSK